MGLPSRSVAAAVRDRRSLTRVASLRAPYPPPPAPHFFRHSPLCPAHAHNHYEFVRIAKSAPSNGLPRMRPLRSGVAGRRAPVTRGVALATAQSAAFAPPAACICAPGADAQSLVGGHTTLRVVCSLSSMGTTRQVCRAVPIHDIPSLSPPPVPHLGTMRRLRKTQLDTVPAPSPLTAPSRCILPVPLR